MLYNAFLLGKVQQNVCLRFVWDGVGSRCTVQIQDVDSQLTWGEILAASELRVFWMWNLIRREIFFFFFFFFSKSSPKIFCQNNCVRFEPKMSRINCRTEVLKMDPSLFICYIVILMQSVFENILTSWYHKIEVVPLCRCSSKTFVSQTSNSKVKLSVREVNII